MALKKKKNDGKKIGSRKVKVNTVKSAFINRDEDMGENHIIDIYPYTEAKDLKSIDERIMTIDDFLDNIEK